MGISTPSTCRELGVLHQAAGDLTQAGQWLTRALRGAPGNLLPTERAFGSFAAALAWAPPTPASSRPPCWPATPRCRGPRPAPAASGTTAATRTALAWFRAAALAAADTTEFRLAYAEALLRAGRADDARHEYAAAAARDPASAAARQALAALSRRPQPRAVCRIRRCLCRRLRHGERVKQILVRNGEVCLSAVPAPAPRPGRVLVRNAYSCVSTRHGAGVARLGRREGPHGPGSADAGPAASGRRGPQTVPRAGPGQAPSAAAARVYLRRPRAGRRRQRCLRPRHGGSLRRGRVRGARRGRVGTGQPVHRGPRRVGVGRGQHRRPGRHRRAGAAACRVHPRRDRLRDRLGGPRSDPGPAGAGRRLPRAAVDIRAGAGRIAAHSGSSSSRPTGGGAARVAPATEGPARMR